LTNYYVQRENILNRTTVSLGRQWTLYSVVNSWLTVSSVLGTWVNCADSVLMPHCWSLGGSVSQKECMKRWKHKLRKRETLMCSVHTRWWFKSFLELHKSNYNCSFCVQLHTKEPWTALLTLLNTNTCRICLTSQFSIDTG